ncbi:hypothetical protein ACFQH6_02810 [Halobacteriaceae archaeon GCM10025711]
MATETVDRRAAHRRGILVTTVASLTGIAAGLATSAVVGTDATSRMGLLVMAGFALAGMGVMQVLGVDVQEFSTKDHLYVVFMNFALWFITWGVLLTSGITL